MASDEKEWCAVREAGLPSVRRSVTVGLLRLLAAVVLGACTHPVRFRAVTQPVAVDSRPAKHPANPPYPDPLGSATWVSAEDVAFSGAGGITIANLRTGATRTLDQKAYLVYGDGKGRLVFASPEGLGVVEPDGSHRLILLREELGGTTGEVPEEGTLPRVEGLAWSPEGGRLAVLVQARSPASFVVARSIVMVVDPSRSRSGRVVFTRSGLDGMVRCVGWLDPGRLWVYHSDYLEPDDDEGWATNRLEPLPTASAVAVDASGTVEGELLARWPWYVRISAVGQKGVVATVNYPTGSLVEPGAAIFSLLERREVMSVPAGLWPLAVPGSGSGYLALRIRDGEEDLVYVRGDTADLVAGSTTSPFNCSAEVGYWCRGWYVSGDGRWVLRVNDDRLVVYGLR